MTRQAISAICANYRAGDPDPREPGTCMQVQFKEFAQWQDLAHVQAADIFVLPGLLHKGDVKAVVCGQPLPLYAFLRSLPDVVVQESSPADAAPGPSPTDAWRQEMMKNHPFLSNYLQTASSSAPSDSSGSGSRTAPAEEVDDLDQAFQELDTCTAAAALSATKDLSSTQSK